MFIEYTTGGFGCAGILPVDLMSLSGEYNGNTKRFLWSTASETNNDFFTLEKSEDGIVFSEIKRIKGAGNSTIRTDYQTEIAGEEMAHTYYRLKQPNFDGQFSYSNIIHVNCLQDFYDGVSLFPNPASNEAYLKFISILDGKLSYTITDIFGREAESGYHDMKGNEIALETGIKPGIYFVKLHLEGTPVRFPVLKLVKE